MRQRIEVRSQAEFDACVEAGSEKKYGAELAGRMIYAVSRPNKELPDFFANNKDAMDDIKLCAKSE